jgi:flagellar basal-body rod protein FlgB
MMPQSPAFLTFAQTVLHLRDLRENLLAANVANADTPGYKAADIDFPASLSAALNGSASDPAPQYLRGFPVGLDDNDVSLTAEKVEAVMNNDEIADEVTYLHQATSDLITALRPNPNGT